MAKAWMAWMLLCMLPALNAEEVLQDPTLPLAGRHQIENETVKLPRLQGLLLGGRPQRAILDGRSVQPGEWISGFRLVAITRDGVVLERDGQRRTLSLYSDKVKIQ